MSGLRLHYKFRELWLDASRCGSVEGVRHSSDPRFGSLTFFAIDGVSPPSFNHATQNRRCQRCQGRSIALIIVDLIREEGTRLAGRSISRWSFLLLY